MSATTLPAAPPRRRAPPIVFAFRAVYALLVANFLLPAISYVVAPATAEATMDRLNRLLGGGAFPAGESPLWHMLAVGNVMTLAFLCALLLVDLRRFYPALPALLFLKGFSALYSLLIAIADPRLPAFFAVFVLDGATTLAMWLFATRAHRALAAEAAS